MKDTGSFVGKGYVSSGIGKRMSERKKSVLNVWVRRLRRGEKVERKVGDEVFFFCSL